MRKRQIWRLAVLVVMFGFARLSFGQVPIKIRLVNADNGQALQSQSVSVSLLYDRNEKTPPKYEDTIHLESDTKGEALFVLPNPPPAHLSAQVHLTLKNWRCACVALVETANLIQKGISVPQSSAKSSVKPIEPEPKQIIFSARPLTFYERLIAPFVKE